MNDEQITIIRDETQSVIGGIIQNGRPFPDYIPPSWDEWFMGMVYDVARKSKDLSTKVGAIIVRDRRPILIGYNGLPPKVKDVNARLLRPLKYKWTEHAERNAIYCGARYGISTEGTIMYTQAVPCMDCARGIVSAGIGKVIVHKQTQDLFQKHPQWIEDQKMTLEMFKEVGIEIEIMSKPLGKWSYVNEKVYVV